MNPFSFRTGARLVFIASVGVLVIGGPVALARTGCFADDPAFPQCRDLYVDPSPVCKDTITSDQSIDVAKPATSGQYSTTPTNCALSVIRWLPQVDDGPCFSLPESFPTPSYNTPSGPACP